MAKRQIWPVTHILLVGMSIPLMALLTGAAILDGFENRRTRRRPKTDNCPLGYLRPFGLREG